MKILKYYSIFLVLLLVLATSLSCKGDKKKSSESNKEHQEVYTCPMHPEIIRHAPGSCPICGMDLIKKESGSQAINSLQLEALLKPVNSFVVSTVKLAAVQEREEYIEVDVVGTVAYDTRQAGAIASRVNGRIEKLYVRYKYQPVHKGQRIMDIYSPALMTAQQNLLFLLKNDPGNRSLIDAAKDRLRLLGMSAAQVAVVAKSGSAVLSVPVYSNYSGFVTEINDATSAPAGDNMQVSPASNQNLSIKEGMYVQSGQAVFTVYNHSRAWILLDIFPEQQAFIKVGNPVRIVPETAPGDDFRATVDYIEPVFRPGKKTLAARVYLNNATRSLPIGSRVSASVFAKPKLASWLPKEAVLSLGRDKIVFKKEVTGFRATKVITGLEINKHFEIVSGLRQQDSVAANAQYLVDNEAFIKAMSNE